MTDCDVMPDFDKLPSISILDTAALPDFDDDAPTATNLTSKKKKKKKKAKTPTPSSSSSSSSSSKLSKSSKPKSKKKKKTQPRKASAIRDRVKKYDEMTRKADAESKEIKNPGKKGIDKDNTKSDKKTGKKKGTKKKDTTTKSKKKSDDKNSNKSKSKNESKNEDNETPSNTKKGSLSPEPSTTDGTEDGVDAPSLLIQESTDSQRMLNATRMLESISPINASMMDTSNLFNDDDNKSQDSDDPLYKNNETQIDESKHDDSKQPPPAFQIKYQIKSLSLPSDPDEINIDTSFEAMYEPSYRHKIVRHPNNNNDNVKTPDSVSTEDQEPPKLLKGRDGDTDRQLIKEKIAEKEQFKAKLKRKQSRTTAFDAKKQNSNLWGRKINEFPTKNGKLNDFIGYFI